MKIWVDADACPAVIKEILFRVAERTGISITLVANHFMPVPALRNIKLVTVSAGFDVADNEIVRLLERGDLVITGDIPLAAEIIEKGGAALNPRGEMYSKDTIKQRLTMRDFMETLRASGIHGDGAAPMNLQDRQRFANALDRFVARYNK